MKYRCFLCASSGHREPLWKVPQSTLPGNPPCGSVTLQGVHGLENMGKMVGTTDVQWFSHISPITFGSLSFVRVSAFFLWRDHRFSINTPPLIDSPTSFPMIFPWFSHDVPMIFPWFPHDFPMIFPWFARTCGLSPLSWRDEQQISWCGGRLGQLSWRQIGKMVIFDEGKWGFNEISWDIPKKNVVTLQ